MMTTYNEYLNNKREIQNIILEYIENDEINGISFQNFVDYCIQNDLGNNKECLKTVLYLILRISKNHYRTLGFYDKISSLLNHLANPIKLTYSNIEIFKIFRKDRKILLYLIQNQILIIDQSIVDIMIDLNICHFFYPEVKPFLTQKTINEIEKDLFSIDQDIFTTFEEKRQMGENDSYICELIRKDSIDDFIVYVNKNNIKLNSYIRYSIFETNPFLIKKESKITLIEYATFFGSIRIFNYIRLNEAWEYLDLWYYAIHSNNPEIISIIEEKCVPTSTTISRLINMAIKCHHNDLANYFMMNYPNKDKSKDKYYDFIFHYYNFAFFPENEKLIYLMKNACKYNYLDIVKIVLNDKDYDVNEMYITEFGECISPINFAAKKNNRDIVNLILSNPEFKIADKCFSNADKMDEIEIPDNIKYIGASAFYNCTSLKRVIIPSSVKEIRKSAFLDDRYLKEIEIKAPLKKISRQCFMLCVHLEKINIPPSVTLIEEDAFYDCQSLTQITLPSSVKKIENGAFMSCKSLQEITIGSKIIGPYAFRNCIRLVRVKLLSSVITISHSAFSQCYSLNELNISPSSHLKKIENNAFGDSFNLNSVTFPHSLISIDTFAFPEKTKLIYNKNCNIC